MKVLGLMSPQMRFAWILNIGNGMAQRPYKGAKSTFEGILRTFGLQVSLGALNPEP